MEVVRALGSDVSSQQVPEQLEPDTHHLVAGPPSSTPNECAEYSTATDHPTGSATSSAGPFRLLRFLAALGGATVVCIHEAGR